MSQTRKKSEQQGELTPLELMRIAPMTEAEHLSGLSAETLQRNYSQFIIELSARRKGMRVKHALMLRDGEI
jgi:hypothetical protein